LSLATDSVDLEAPLVVDLSDEAAVDPALTGGKGSALAAAARAELPTLEGLVLTTAFTASVDRGADLSTHPVVDLILQRFGDRSLVVRSSSTIEDTAASSMAGRFDSVLDVQGRDALVSAIRTVLDSRQRAAEVGDVDVDAPLAIVVQPFLRARTGGVLFGVDPVTGRSDRIVAVASEAGPDAVVSGRVDGVRYVLRPDGSVVSVSGDEAERRLNRRQTRQLAELEARTAQAFGGPQDMEWLLEANGTLRLLQSRPVTTEIAGRPRGPIFGPGPVAETFPAPLSRLEQSLWVPPLRRAMREALVLAGTATRDTVESRRMVVVVDGWVALDLEVTGGVGKGRSRWDILNPIKGFRRLRSAWDIGRLRAALPGLARDLVDHTDTELRTVPEIRDLTDRQLLAMINRLRQGLVALHAHEILMGALVDPEAPEVTGASVALRVLSEARRDGLDDETIVAENPVVLALVPPRVARTPSLPAAVTAVWPASRPGQTADPAAVLRESLRLRARWLQELSGRAAWELGRRLTVIGALPEPDAVRHLHWQDLRVVILERSVPVLAAIDAAQSRPQPQQLPGCFRLTDRGRPVSTVRPGSDGDGIGAGGGRGEGVVTHDTDNPPSDSVLVVTTLSPTLAPLLPRLAGLVAETGNPLAHLAILAREASVPTVVSLAGARETLPEGIRVHVDGIRGSVSRVEEPDEDDADGSTETDGDGDAPVAVSASSGHDGGVTR
jgi:rifampicin phosphotransferase